MNVSGVQTLIVSILVLYIGGAICERIQLLRRLNIPSVVVGGLLCSLIVAGVRQVTGQEIDFDLVLRDLLLLVFFSTIGLGAKLRNLVEGGRALALLVLVAIGFLILQNLTGISVALLFGRHPAYGLIAGSISFAGGFGTAISWGEIAANAGLPRASEAGVACATFGLIAGGLLGGPLTERLIKKYRLQGPKTVVAESSSSRTDGAIPVTLSGMLGTILALAVCVSAGDLVNQWLQTQGLGVPGFLTALLVGVVLTNLVDLCGQEINQNTISLCGDISLEIFLSISLMSMQLWELNAAAWPLSAVVVAQILVMVVTAYFVVFRVMGRNYDAAVMSAGFVGMGLGATPVAMANMDTIVKKHGVSPKAFLVIPLLGAFFIDIANAFILRVFLMFPFLQIHV